MAISVEFMGRWISPLKPCGKDVTRWNDRVSTGGSEDLNLFEFHRIVLEKLHLTVEEKFELDAMSVRKSETELNIALREALTNMIVHAD